MTSRLTHIDEDGKAQMVDVGGKPISDRTATAKGRVLMASQTLSLIIAGSIKKGDVIAIARIAGIMAAKRTADTIPLCHPLILNKIDVDLNCDPDRNAVDILATCKTSGRTGVEMEALTAVSAAALTVYDMCKAIDREMRITDIRLIHKAGGNSGEYQASE